MLAALHRDGEVLVEVHADAGTRVRARLDDAELHHFSSEFLTAGQPGGPGRLARVAAPTSTGYVPPPYPQDRLDDLVRIARQHPGELVDCSVGTPVDPMPQVALDALIDAAPRSTGVSVHDRLGRLREAAGAWIGRRFGVAIAAEAVVACIGTKEVVAGLPRMLSLRDPGRDTVLYPAVSYPTYAMGAELAGLRAVPIPVDDHWRLDLTAIDPDDARRALLLWLNDPSNPTGVTASPERLAAAVDWGRDHGIIVASDECYAEFTYDESGAGADPVTALSSGADGVLAVHSLSKRSNMAGLRAGFVAGDRELVRYLGEVRKHSGLMTPAPIQAAAAAAWATTSTSRCNVSGTRAAAPRCSRPWNVSGSSTTAGRRRSTSGCVRPRPRPARVIPARDGVGDRPPAGRGRHRGRPG